MVMRAALALANSAIHKAHYPKREPKNESTFRELRGNLELRVNSFVEREFYLGC